MQVIFLLEEESAEDALRQLIPRLLPAHYVPRFRSLGGWQGLVDNLPTLLRAYGKRMTEPGQQDLRIVVLLDADGVAERRFKLLEDAAKSAGLLTLGQAKEGQLFHVFNALAVQELEAWFLGDRQAITDAYPKVKTHHFKGIDREPESSPKPNDVLWGVLKAAGLYTTGKRKREWAETIAAKMDPGRNQSASFQYFRAGLGLLEAPAL
ncbi:DUF4276 family protein [Hymenobacter chitinivorans]|uniref:Uncharacterized protein DUF4276 n=1 Tax=Hymenobacter chitinivorans DSM 11115 TaxID=1121954 RepID=A0A2M9B959_9BACT|nr:DUF4276 family protein [Hymenobacter chitinivorans]PJJ54471.1 uncharacterized protein DUF4276 [Hymenobacter chitinivorans DSM 11115]